MSIPAYHFIVGPASQFLQHMQWRSLLNMPACPRVPQIVPPKVFYPCSDECFAPSMVVGVLPENTYYLIFLNFFRGDVNLVSSVIVAAEEDPEP